MWIRDVDCTTDPRGIPPSALESYEDDRPANRHEQEQPRTTRQSATGTFEMTTGPPADSRASGPEAACDQTLPADSDPTSHRAD